MQDVLTIPGWAAATFGGMLGVLLSIVAYYLKRMSDRVDELVDETAKTRLYGANTYQKREECAEQIKRSETAIARLDTIVGDHGARLVRLETLTPSLEKKR